MMGLEKFATKQKIKPIHLWIVDNRKFLPQPVNFTLLLVGAGAGACGGRKKSAEEAYSSLARTRTYLYKASFVRF